MYMSGVHQCVQVTQQNVLQLAMTNKARNYHWSNGAHLIFLAVSFFFQLSRDRTIDDNLQIRFQPRRRLVIKIIYW